MAGEEKTLDISNVLFKHVLDGHTLELFPGLPEIHLPPWLSTHGLMLILATSVVTLLFVPLFRKPQLKVRGVSVALEALVLFVRDDIVYPIMGEERGDKWLPFFSTLFIFLLTINYIGLIPAFKTATGNINVTSALALIILALIFIIGFKNLGSVGFFKNMYPEGVPWPIGIFVLFLEFIGIFLKTMVLSIRIFANMFAGHIGILCLLVLIFVLHPLMAFISLPGAFFSYALEVLVAFIQALVFTLLSCVYITMASSHH